MKELEPSTFALLMEFIHEETVDCSFFCPNDFILFSM